MQENMHTQLLSQLMETIKTQNQIIKHLLGMLNLSELPGELQSHLNVPKSDTPVSLDYQKMQVDKPPVFEVLDKLDYRVLLAAHLELKGKPLKPVARRLDSVPIPKKLTCPRCDAPATYLYDNSGGRGQYECKICDCHFNQQNRYHKDVCVKCPYCLKLLQKVKQRNDFDIFKCVHQDCPHYQKLLDKMTKEERLLYEEKPFEFKLHYIYRSFTLNLVPLVKDQLIRPKVDLSKIYASPEVVGLILTYYVNYGLSARTTSAIMKDIHNITVSHQTIRNYASALKPLFEYFNANFPYELSNSFCGDETYIRVRGKWHYLCFFFDTVKKIILAHPISKHRDHILAITAINDLISKLPEIPDNLELVTDGNPIYLLAQQFFAQHNINFDVKQVIGLTNKDEVSKEYRPLKNVIERLNRTYKTAIRHFFGFGSIQGAENFTTLFVAFFNFLRPHSALDSNVPVIIPELLDAQTMPAKWIKLIQYAQNFALTPQLH
jgi:transposase-like protein